MIKANERINNIALIILYLFAMVFIKVMYLDTKNYFYFVTIISLLFVGYKIIDIKNINKLIKYNKSFKLFCIVILLYLLYVIVLTTIVEKGSYIYTINIIVPFITMIFLICDIYNNRSIELLNKTIFSIFFISSIIALIMFLFGYSKVDLTFEGIIAFTPTKHYLDSGNEFRLTWLTSHKSRYALYCLIGIMFVYSDELINKKLKIGTIILLYINLLLTSSITSIGIGGLAFLFMLRKEIISLLKKFKWIRIITFVIVPLIVIIALVIISAKRNIFTLGSRLYIWESAVKQIIKQPLGIVAMGSSFLMHNPGLNFPFTNGHNIFLNEFIERGIIGGLLFIGIIIFMFKLYYKCNKSIYIWANVLFILGALIDYTIAAEMTYIYWYINAFWCAQSLANVKTNKIFI